MADQAYELVDWTPAFPGQRPPFENGNGAAVRHGAQSPAMVEARLPAAVEEVVQAIARDTPYLAAPDMFLVERLARLLVRARLIDDHLDRQDGSLIDERGRPRGPAELSLRLEHQIREHCKVLGLSPTTRAELTANVEGARERRWREAQERLRQRVNGDG
jgi:hypothetical protein